MKRKKGFEFWVSSFHFMEPLPSSSSSSSSSLHKDIIMVDDSINHCSDPTVHDSPPNPTIDGEIKPSSKCKKRSLVKKNVNFDDSQYPSTSSSRCFSSQRGFAVSCHRRNPRFPLRRRPCNVDSIGFPLGMSFAAVIAQVTIFFLFCFFLDSCNVSLIDWFTFIILLLGFVCDGERFILMIMLGVFSCDSCRS